MRHSSANSNGVSPSHGGIVVVDFGSQYTNVIARRVRETGVFAEVMPYWTPLKKILAHAPKGIILSGGPAFVSERGSPKIPKELFDAGIPILGICYGLQYMAHALGGKVRAGKHREYGPAVLTLRKKSPLLRGIPKKSFRVWMSHGDQVTRRPRGFQQIADSPTTTHAAVADERRHLYGIQFHPEVSHTQYGMQMLKNFVFEISKCAKTWQTKNWTLEGIKKIRAHIGKKRVVAALSGGVDSTVAATLVYHAIGRQLTCLYVDTGMMRKDETREVLAALRKLKLPVTLITAEKLFLTRLRGITAPEQKRKIIGRTFIDVFDRAARRLGNVEYLVQGTLYSDVIESAPASDTGRKTAHTIKSHHNVGGLPTKMRLKLIEPVRELFKDEVRRVGKELKIPPEILNRHPFPGPGLAIRIMGEVTPARLAMLREADAIMREELHCSGWYEKIWQSSVILTGVRTTAVMGDARTYHEVAAIRLVHSQDAMTAHWVKLPHPILERISTRIVNEVRGITRVVYDISNKPPATIEWE